MISVKAFEVGQIRDDFVEVVSTNGESGTGIIPFLLFIEMLQFFLLFFSFFVKSFTSF